VGLHPAAHRLTGWTRQRLEKLLEDSLIKISAVASSLTRCQPAMLEALIANERDPKVPAPGPRPDEAKRRADEALTGKFDDHHAELARMLLDQVDACPRSASSPPGSGADHRDPAAQGVDADGTTGPGAGTGAGRRRCHHPA
jgi:hypothetical protein